MSNKVYQTELFNELSTIGKGQFASAVSNLIQNGNVKGVVQDQLLFLTDITTSPDIIITYWTNSNGRAVEVRGHGLHVQIEAIDTETNTCYMNNKGHICNPTLEYFDGLISVLEAGEVVCIVPIGGGYD
jgi:hypothetical protein